MEQIKSGVQEREGGASGKTPPPTPPATHEFITCRRCQGIGWTETGVDRIGHGVGTSRCSACGGSGSVEVKL